MGSNWLSNSAPKGEVDRGEGPGPEGVNGISADPLTRLRRELQQSLPNSSPQGEVDRGEGPGPEGVNGARLSRPSPETSAGQGRPGRQRA